jgi:hypothetical protein
LQNRLRPIVHRQIFVFLPIEVASIAFAIHVRQLQQPLLARDAVSHRIGHRYLGLVVTHCNSRFQSCLRSGQRLKEIRPEGAPFFRVCLLEPRAERPDCAVALA